MEIKASLNQLRMSPRKVRLVADVVRGMKTDKALDQLRFGDKKAALPILKLVESAIANAVNNYDLDKDNLYIKSIMIDEGATLKRWTPKAHGRATTVRKRSCHIHLILAELKDSGKKEAKNVKIEAPVKLEDLVKASDESNAKKVRPVKKITKKSEEVTPEIIDPRMEGRHGHAVIEGGSSKGFAGKIFRRKSG
jgi:large subunit ribosomal protein L22